MRKRPIAAELLAVLLSVVLPGAGHALLRMSRPVWWVTFGFAAAVWLVAVALVVTAVVSPATALEVLANATVVGVAAWVLVLSAALTLVATAHLAWLLVRRTADSPARSEDPREGRTGTRPLRWLVVVVAALLVVVTVPAQGYAAAFAFAQQRILSSLFADGAGIEPVDGRYNLLVAGFDAAPGRETMRPDSIHVASVDALTGQLTLIGVARDTRRFPVPEGSGLEQGFLGDEFCQNGCQLNIAYRFGEEHPELYPDADDPGIAAVTEAVTGYTGLELSGYVAFDMDGFAALIDAIGGVTVQVNRDVERGSPPDPDTGAPAEPGPEISAGVQTFDGQTALWFARSRLNTSNADRMLRQRCVAEAAFEQIDPFTLLSAANTLIDSNAITTDIPAAALGDLAELAVKSRSQPFRTLELADPLVTPVRPDVEYAQLAVAEVLAGRDVPPRPSPLAGVLPETEVRSEPEPQQGDAAQDGGQQDAGSDAPCEVP